MKRIIVLTVIILGLGLSLVGLRQLVGRGSEVKGILRGHIILYPIGSACDERSQCSRPASDQLVEVRRPDNTLAARGQTNDQGVYSFKLPAGSYTLAVPAARYGRGANNLPNPVTIQANATTTVDVTIDTGVR